MTCRTLAVMSLLLLSGCSGSTTPSPGPSPLPTSQTITVTLTDTVTGAAIGSSVQTAAALPALLTFTHPGYVTRETWIHSASATVDLIPEAGFDLTFYRQFVRGALEGRMDPLRRWTVHPSIYLQRAGLSDATVAALERAARDVVPALTGGRLSVAAWETGQERRSAQSGWITVELRNAPEHALCGEAVIGGGSIWMNVAPKCIFRREQVHPNGFAHELGHALGFWHVDRADALMTQGNWSIGAPSQPERHHAALAYARAAGNMDVDSDARTSGAVHATVVLD